MLTLLKSLKSGPETPDPEIRDSATRDLRL